MRCPDCNKFVSLETQEPQVDSIEARFTGTGFDIEASGSTARNCADCSMELKLVSWTAESHVELGEFEGYDKLTDNLKKDLQEALDDDTISADVEEHSTEADESGGSRYKKNIITSRINFDISLPVLDDKKWPKDKDKKPIELTHSGTVESRNAASEFEEQV